MAERLAVNFNIPMYFEIIGLWREENIKIELMHSKKLSLSEEKR
jgi:hypothetical protein